MNPLTVDLKGLLVSAGVVDSDPASQDWASQIGRFSDQPDNLVCLRDAPSRAPDYIMGKTTIQIDACGVVIRSTDYSTGYIKGIEVAETLEMNEAKMIGDTRYWAIRRTSSVHYLDRDINGRHLFQVSFEVHRENQTKET